MSDPDKNKKVLGLITQLMDSSSDSDLDIYEILNDSDDEEELLLLTEIIYNQRNRNSIFLEEVTPTYTEEEFRWNFRVSRELFEELVIKFETSEVYLKLRPDKRGSARKHLAVFLWFAGNECCAFRDLAKRFDLSIHAAFLAIDRVTEFFNSMSDAVLTWPTEERKKETSRYFQTKYEFSKAIGCIDSIRINIGSPKDNRDEYIDQTGNASLMLQAICDENKKIINVFVGYPGSTLDSWVFENSPIYKKLSSKCGEYYLLGDNAYNCTKHLITPYTDNGHLNKFQKDFNSRLSSSHDVTIANTLEALKQRFQQLNYCKLKNVKKICQFVTACCVLHNMSDQQDIEFCYEKEIDTNIVHFNNLDITYENRLRNKILNEMIKSKSN